MKRKLLFSAVCFLLFGWNMRAQQQLEDFETETLLQTSFTSGTQAFNITTTTGGTFEINSVGPATGWNGTAADNQYIDNTRTTAANVLINTTISSVGAKPFTIQSMYCYMANAADNLTVSGSLTIVGKLGGVTKFTATASTGFNTTFSVNKGFTFINMTTFGGSNNSAIVIDQLNFTTGGNYFYMAIDAFKWTPTLTASITSTNVSCNGGSNGSATATASGGPTPITYSWAPSGGTAATATGLTAGNYTVTVTDNLSKTATATVTITQPSAILTNTMTTSVACNGGSSGVGGVSVSGGTTPYSYSWAPSGGTSSIATGLTAGIYTVTVTDAKLCTATRTLTITQPTAITTTPTYTATSCNGGSNGRAAVTVSGGVTPYVYSWSPSGGTSSLATGLAAGNYTCTITDDNSCQKTQTVSVTQPAAITTVASYTATSCNGGSNGSASVTASGGTPSYFYSWAPSGGTAATATGLSAGNYTCTVTDNNSCTKTQTVSVTQPAAITTTATYTATSCNGGSNGSASVSVTGGSSPYTYSWAPSGGTAATATGLSAGNYTCTVTDNNSCTKTQTVSVTQPAALNASTVITNIACNGGSTGAINLTPTGGTSPYTFDWGSSITTEDRTGLTAGTYTVIITDANSCTKTQTVSVSQPSAAVSGTTVITSVSCNGGSNGSVNLTPTGGTGPYTFNWGGGVTTEDRTGLIAGTYTVTITDANSCTGTVNPVVTQPTAVSGTTVITEVSCNGGSNGTINLTPTGGTGPYTYNWGGGISTEDRTGLTAGAYTVTITDDNSCTGTLNPVVTQPSALSSSVVAVPISCFGGANGQASVTPTGGKTPYAYSWAPSGGTAFKATGLAQGNYTCTITDNNGCTKTQTVSITQPASAVNASTTITNIACYGGSTGTINLTPSGGTGPYTFNWGGGVSTEDRTGLAEGTYTVVITDANSCTKTQTVSVSQPSAAVSGTTVITSVSCNGGSNGSINLTPTGGTGPYTFNWGGGVSTEDRTGLTAGVYTVTITDANSCTAILNPVVTQPSALSSSVAAVPISCFGGSNGQATVTATGGTTPYSYSWAPSGGTAFKATGLAQGTYTCTITDNNSCTKTQTVTITQPASAVSASTTITNVACYGGSTGSINLTPSGGTSPYTYDWGGGITTEDRTALAEGTYTVTITDANSCTKTQTVSISQPGTAVSGNTIVTGVSCTGGANGAINLTPSGGTGSYTFNWGGGITTEDRTGLTAGTYTVIITDANNCTSTLNPVVSQPIAAVSGTTVVTGVSCFGGANGAINLTPTGGTGPYTFDWGGGITTEDRTGLTAGTYTVIVSDLNSCTATINPIVTQPTALSSTVVPLNVSCFGGSNGQATVTATGGTAPYTYSWAPTGGTGFKATGLAQGNYTCTITDNNSCTKTQTVTITQPNALTTSITSTNVSCFGGSDGTATVTATGGTTPYAYSWAPSGGTGSKATGLAQGTYTCTITDANLCTATQTITISQPITAITSSVTQTNVSCYGGANGTATVTATGGTGTLTYDWTPGNPVGDGTKTITGLAEGSYTCTITDANACTATQTVTITQPVAALSASLVSTNVACYGGTNGTATVTATGGTAPYSYVWDPYGGTDAKATGLAQGTYTCTVTDANACVTTQTVSITQPPALTLSVTSANVSCYGGADGSAKVTVTGGTAPYTYVWDPYGGTDAKATGLEQGTYTCTVTDAHACKEIQTVNITQPDSLLAAIVATNVTCNGKTDGKATVAVKGGTLPYTYAWAPNGGTDTTATGLAPGTYTCTITDAKSCSITQTVTITEPAVLMATISNTNATCFGVKNGSATVTPNGGTQPYTYLWAPGNETTSSLKNLGMGTYTVTVTDAAGCGATKTVIVTEPTKLIVSGTATLLNCYGQQSTVTITASGATPPYMGTGTFMKAAGKYTFVVSDSNACMDSVPIEITQPNAIEFSQTISVCYGETYTVGDSVYSTSGNYINIFKAANGCDSTVKTMLTVDPMINIKVTLSGNILTAEDNTSIYQWIDCNNGNSIIPGATSQTFTPAQNGYYAVILKRNKCTDTSECVLVILTGIENHEENNALRVFPNPSNGTFTVQAAQAGSYTIVNELGQIVKSFQLTSATNYTTTINDLSNGSYSIISISNNQFIRQKIIILQP
jgi:hypothetical protein